MTEAKDLEAALRTALRNVAEARETLGLAQAQEAEAKADLEQTVGWLNYELARENRKLNEALVDTFEERVRNMAVEAYRLTGKTAPAPGVTVKLFQRMTYTVEAATAWARTAMPNLLVLDIRRFEKVVKYGAATEAPVTVAEEPRGLVAGDLSGYLSRTEDEDAAT